MKKSMLKKFAQVSASAIFAAAFMNSAAFAGLVNMNTASAAALAHHLSGVGVKKAQAIIDYRKANGKFQSIDDITEVKGIGAGLLRKNRKNLSLSKGAVAMSKKGKKGKKTPLVISKKATAKPERVELFKTKKPVKKVATAKPVTVTKGP